MLVNTARAPPSSASASSTAAPACVTVPATELAREHLGRPLPNAALLGAFAALTGVVTLESRRRRDPRALPGRARPRATSPPRAAALRRSCARSWPMLRQIEGSRAVAETVALLPARGHRGLPDLAADAHRRGALASS